MQKNTNNRFNTEPLVLEIENVVKKGLKTILKDFINRYDLLENTHRQIMKLPSVLNEMNKQESESDSDDVDDADSDLESKESENLKVIQIENKLDIMEKKYDLIIPILNKILNKVDVLNEEVKILKKNKNIQLEEDSTIAQESEPAPAPISYPYHIKPSIISACENENITFKITEDEVVSTSNNEIQFCKLEEQVEEEQVEEEQVEEEQEQEEEQEEAETSDKEEEQEEAETSDKEEEQEEEEKQEEEQEEEEQIEEQEEEQEEAETNDKEEEEEQEEQEEEEQEEQEEVEEEEQEEVEEEEDEKTDKEESVETETSDKEEEKEEEEEEELFEIEIDDVTYCTNNEENGFIYELSEDGEVGNKIGYLKESEPFFYADEK